MSRIKFKRIPAMIAAVTAAVLLLSACTEIRLAGPMSSKTLLTINDEPCSVAEAIFRLMEVRDYYKADEDDMFWYRAIGDITFDEYIKDSVKDEMLKITASVLMSDEMALYITEEEQNQIISDATEAYTGLSDHYDLAKYGITLDTAIDLYTKQAYYNKVFNKLSENINLEISEADTKVIEVNYVEIPVSVSINEAEEFRKEVRNGTSFQTACEKYGWEPVMNRVLMKGMMPESFEYIAYALTDGELSEIVETTECLYVIQCIEDYMISESVANNNQVMSAARKALFDEHYSKFAEGVLLRFNDSAWDEISVPEL